MILCIIALQHFYIFHFR